jgi:hypothetical protein
VLCWQERILRLRGYCPEKVDEAPSCWFCPCGDFELSSSLTTCFEEDAIIVQSLARAYKNHVVPVWHILVERETDIEVECSNELFILKDYSFG